MKDLKNITPLLVGPIPPPSGGDSSWTLRYLEYSSQNGYNVVHVNTSMIGKRAESVSDGVNLFDEFRRCIRIWKNIKKSLSKNDIDVVHFNTNCSPRGLIRDYLSLKIIKRKNKKIILHCRCNVDDQIKNNSKAIKYFKKITGLVDLVFVQNNFSLTYVKEISNVPTEIMPNYIDDSIVSNQHTIKENIYKVIFVGHIRKTKGIDELIEVAKANPDIEFSLIGPITIDYSIDYFRNIKNIELKGPLDFKSILNEIDSADLFLFPTYTEGFSNAILEAMARGVPVITTNVGANMEMLENRGGIIVNSRNVNDLISALNAIKDIQTRKAMSIWNINKVKEEYCISNVYLKIRKKYWDLLYEDYK